MAQPENDSGPEGLADPDDEGLDELAPHSQPRHSGLSPKERWVLEIVVNLAIAALLLVLLTALTCLVAAWRTGRLD
jgi:hypothetical protein